MRTLLPLLFLPLFVLMSTGCADGCASQDASAPAPKEINKALRPDVKVKETPSRKAYTAEELNQPYSTVSPWRYIVTGPENQYFERLVSKSKLARTVHNSGHAVLVPRDLTFTENRDWKGLLDEENAEALDRFIRAHIIVGIKSKKSLEGTYEDLNGNTATIKSDDMGQLTCGGARILGQEVETDQGLVIPVVGMVESIRWI